ncbi:hypothetical protein C8Q79DRAFT_896898, partial [Trametes meyenii]
PSTEPRPSHKPEPLGNWPLLILFTTCTLCAVFLLWRRASELRSVVAHQLTNWPHGDGRIRLSMDEGPSAREFLDDDYDEDNARVGDDEPLVVTADRLRQGVVAADDQSRLRPLPEQPTLVFEAQSEVPPPPPPKT